jgi:hypothetical protein
MATITEAEYKRLAEQVAANMDADAREEFIVNWYVEQFREDGAEFYVSTLHEQFNTDAQGGRQI